MNKSIYYWLDIIAAINGTDRILSLWVHNKDSFFNRFMVINDDEVLIIGDKQTHKIYEYKKTLRTFKIDFQRQDQEKEVQERILFKFKNIEVIKR